MSNQIRNAENAYEMVLSTIGNIHGDPEKSDTSIRRAMDESTARMWYGRESTYTVVENLGKLWPEGTTVELVGSSAGRCLMTASYAVKSPVELTDKDFELLRAQDCFMNGQEHGLVQSHNVVDGVHVYHVYSLCDSSD